MNTKLFVWNQSYFNIFKILSKIINQRPKAENFRIMNIEINFFLQINLIFIWTLNSTDSNSTDYQSVTWINRSSNLRPKHFADNQWEKSFGSEPSRDIQKRRLLSKSKVSTVNIEIKRTGSNTRDSSTGTNTLRFSNID